MGRCYESLNETQQAEECFLMCATENPADFDSRLRLAEIYEATNRTEEAMAIVEAGIRP
jgi:tetratricopeptide (TPR) repeat protein